MNRNISACALCALLLSVSSLAHAQYRGDVNNDGRITVQDLALLVEQIKAGSKYSAVSDVNADGLLNTADIIGLRDILLGLAEPSSIGGDNGFDGLLTVTWNGSQAATVSGLPSDGSITAEVSGADVVITNSLTDREVTLTLQGESSSGSLVYNGEYKTTFVLNGVKLKGSTQEAVNIKCGKRIALKVNADTENTLEDADTDGGQKAALHTKGHLELAGAGKLTLKGNVKHALSAKEYVEIKKSAGIINIIGAAGDGIHAGQYYQQNGGTLVINAVGGDGIQAEVTDDPTDENNGQVIIKGGDITITTTAADASCIQSDSLMTISGGTFTLTTSGTCAKGINTDGDLLLTGGHLTIKSTGNGGRGIKVEGSYVQGSADDGSGPTLSVTTTGSKYTTGSSTGGTGGGGFWGPGGMGGGNRPGGGGMGGSTTEGTSAKGIKVDGTITIYGGETTISTATDGAEGLESKQKVLGAVRILGGRHYLKCYDDCINSAGGISFEGGTTVCYAFGNDAVDSNYGKSGAIVLAGGNLLTYTTKGSPEEGLDCDNNSYIKITGPANVIALGGAQGGGSSSGIGSASQGYVLSTSGISLQSGRYYTLAGSNGTNLFTFSLEASVTSSMSLITAAGMTSGSSYTLKYSTSAPTDATTSWHGLYLGSSAKGTTSVTSFTAK